MVCFLFYLYIAPYLHLTLLRDRIHLHIFLV